MSLTQTQKENLTKLVEALRSGKYEQGQNCLRSYDNKYCCLGVAYDLAGVEWKLTNSETNYAVIFPDADEDTALVNSPTVREMYGFRSAFGNLPFLVYALTSMNDNGTSFKEIADEIEKVIAKS